MQLQDLKLNHSSIDQSTLESWMDRVLDELRRGLSDGQSPFAAGIFSLFGVEIALAHNSVAGKNQPSRHGEVNAIDLACEAIGNPDLSGHILVSSGEPCPMCTATAAIAKVDAIVFGAAATTIQQAGYETLDSRCEDMLRGFGKDIPVIGGVREMACDDLLLRNPK